jgi:hypothetical protein
MPFSPIEEDVKFSTIEDNPKVTLAMQEKLSEAVCRDISRVLERHGLSDIHVLNSTQAQKPDAQHSGVYTSIMMAALVLAVTGVVILVSTVIVAHEVVPIF